jgi:hypothetical protein
MSEARIDRLERDVDRINSDIALLHSGSMQLVTTAFTEMERRLGEKIDAHTSEVVARVDKLSDRTATIERFYVTRGLLTGLIAFLVVQFLVVIGLGLGLIYELLARHG